MDIDNLELESKIKQLEKSVWILQKKLERSEADRINLEKASELKESLLKSVIRYQIITELHKGKLECYSTPGNGAEFVITIPVRQDVK